MTFIRTIALATAVAAGLSACAQVPASSAAKSPGATTSMAGKPSTAGAPGQMAMMDSQMKAMHAMHEKMSSARTPAERNALMAEHHKLMQEGMSMMGGMGPGGMGAMMGMGGAPGATSPADIAARQQMMEKHMEMMQSTMQMMMDRLPPPAAGQ
ncbi:hypothetical protein [Piscinibacter sp.]|uniref:hypothetical protein n=1 Tax=Piscinibacter sp. TaxID=1903157 RepID=UPI002C01675C|nr:hypothetical protein [Albitalea sp.]HUG24492.1 hypothetical protein [Albitalea sp.]